MVLHQHAFPGPYAYGGSLSAQLETIAYLNEDTLDHPMIQPLAKLLGHELDVMRAACQAIDLKHASPSRPDVLILSLLELRKAIPVWEGGHRGQVRLYELPSTVYLSALLLSTFQQSSSFF